MVDNISIKETWVNRTKNYIVGESEYYETFTSTLGTLFLDLQREYGRCISKVYVDLPGGEANPIGWVFEKKVKYDDVDEYYLQETWISLEHLAKKGD